MLYMGLGTMLFGLTEPLFVPNYWNPPTLFNLAQTTGFDIESFIFTFAIGGIGSVFYKIVVKKNSVPENEEEKINKRHKYHVYLLLTPIPIFLLLAITTTLNHIYCGIIAMFAGAIATLYCRPDLKVKIWFGGILFLVLYSIFFFTLLILHPGYVTHVWNLKALTGIIFIGIPLEELLFAFSFGMYWSSIYEHLLWKKLTLNGQSNAL